MNFQWNSQNNVNFSHVSTCATALNSRRCELKTVTTNNEEIMNQQHASQCGVRPGKDFKANKIEFLFS